MKCLIDLLTCAYELLCWTLWLIPLISFRAQIAAKIHCPKQCNLMVKSKSRFTFVVKYLLIKKNFKIIDGLNINISYVKIEFRLLISIYCWCIFLFLWLFQLKIGGCYKYIILRRNVGSSISSHNLFYTKIKQQYILETFISVCGLSANLLRVRIW